MTEEKYRRIYFQYYRLVKNVAYGVLHDADLAEDVCQEVFLLFLEKEEIVEEEFYPNWFSVNAKRKAIDFCRKSYQVHEVTVAGVPEEDESAEEVTDKIRIKNSGRNSFEDEILNNLVLRELTERILEDLEKKNPDWYEIVIRMYIRGEDAEETARALGISIENLRTKKHRLKMYLTERYKDDFEEA